MKKAVIIAAAALIGLGSLPSETRADDGAIAAGIIGGLAVGALAGAAIADSNRPPAVAYGEEEYVTVYRPHRRIRVYPYEGSPYRGYYRSYRYRYDDGS